MVDVFTKRMFELLALTETKVKGNGEFSWCGGNGIIVHCSVQEIERIMESLAVGMNDVWHSAVIDLGCVSSRILRITFKFLSVKACVTVVYGPTEDDVEERGSLICLP